MSNDWDHTIDGARQAAAQDQLHTWVGDFLASPGSDNADLAEQLGEASLWWLGPVEVPLDQLHRLAGPAGHPVVEPVEDSGWRDDVEELAARIEAGGEQVAPVIATFRDGQLSLEDGNHRVEALRRAGLPRAWTVVGFDGPGARDRFVDRSDPDGTAAR
ncbi:ParB N-terminal domain-containing protein [Iamia majanohamensis]|uniref:ParB N-terminal domain-containing protein n=1 Tax=Iamia majanohamensis TaxID=467976 RepID=A0AAE9YBX1_9ACTN|nr:ParB N-terminal domain-containing protein [Iamia majanohamensis]WCO68204.1 ParB N-terminal domain-containing protein [Iamia majanohamensis]